MVRIQAETPEALHGTLAIQTLKKSRRQVSAESESNVSQPKLDDQGRESNHQGGDRAQKKTSVVTGRSSFWNEFFSVLQSQCFRGGNSIGRTNCMSLRCQHGLRVLLHD